MRTSSGKVFILLVVMAAVWLPVPSVARDIDPAEHERSADGPEENVTSGSPVVSDPDPAPSVESDDIRVTRETVLIAAAIIISSLLAAILIVHVMRRRSVKEVEWESDDDWLSEDWADLDIEDDGTHTVESSSLDGSK